MRFCKGCFASSKTSPLPRPLASSRRSLLCSALASTCASDRSSLRSARLPRAQLCRTRRRLVPPPVTLTAQAVICTIPLGVLKSGSVSFSPALPATHANAIARLGMGTLDKLVLSFPTVFWDASVDWLQRIPAAPYGTPGYGQWVDWASMARCCGHSILVGFNSAAQALALEAQTDEAILASGMAVLRGIYRAGIPDPTTYVVTRWAADPFARGSYSYYRLGSSPTDRTNLQAPVGGRLFFSGEHVSPAYFGTVAGAFLDGQRAASAVADSPFFSTTNAATTPSHTLEL